MSSLKAAYKFLPASALLFILAACSVEKNTSTTRFYHSLTSRYNIWFNGYESFKRGVQKVSAGHRDDYAELLNVFEYSDPSTVSMCSSDMDQAIMKASKLISLKSITAKPEIKDRNKLTPAELEFYNRKEFNDWVDASYLLIAKSHFYKHEFGEAESVLNYTITEANDAEVRKEASVWLARVFNETGKYPDSFRTLNETDIGNESSRYLKEMYYTTFADLNIKQKRYSEAIAPLEKAMDFVSGKRTKYRLCYLLAQLNELEGNSAAATELYRKVVRMNPPYDVEFNARINIAGVFDINSGNPNEIRKELEKMLRNSKNNDYHDQIYFSLAGLAMKSGNEKEALSLYRKSVTVPSSNPNQKGRSYQALGDYYYDNADFIRAGRYYDSTVFFLDQNHPEYRSLREKSADLNTLVSQLVIIQQEDSLQRVAAMPESERNMFIANLINEVTKAETEGRSTDYSDRYNLGQYYENERRFQGNIAQEGKWYFYNQAALTFGRTEFRRRYGDRKLEDNWRRANKITVSSAQPGMTAAESELSGGDEAEEAVLDNKKPEFYLRNLPLTDSLLQVSNEKIALASLNAGLAYSEKIGDNQRANETLESLLRRFPSHHLVPETLYTLYKINQAGSPAVAETYRQRLLERFPETEFAKILSDPEYYEKKLAREKRSEQLYNKAYNEYSEENFTAAISTIDEVLNNDDDDMLIPKFMLLRAYSVARVSDERAFREELGRLIKLWPQTEESKKAGEIIEFLNEKTPELKIEEETVIARELFEADTSSSHIFALIIPDPAFNLNLATFDVISYNIDNYTNRNFRTESSLADDKYIIISVSGFSSFSEAMEYYRKFRIESVVRNSAGKGMYAFVINNFNLEVMRKDKNPERYSLFFRENYHPE
ncbi:MAG TPA: hypothetical protein PLO24_09430 [Bacteroidales bacterium]|nr:hypothetical protein [Bacteroidales bacterium]HQH23774.1 hypothetical protein [Bacteroidales bacterium]HQJ81599.1 hypothetical protein [Bacteroidales bacterium]